MFAEALKPPTREWFLVDKACVTWREVISCLSFEAKGMGKTEETELS